MRISFFVPRCTPENSHGRYVVELAKRLVGEHFVTIYSGSFWSPLRSMVRCKYLPVPNRPAVVRLAALWAAALVVTRRSRADITHVQGADAPFGNVVTAQFCNAAMQSIGGGGGLYHRINSAIGAAAEKYCMSQPSTRIIIAISHQVKGEIEREYGVDPGKVLVIHHGVDGETFNPRHRTRWRDSFRASLRLSLDEFIVLFVGGDYRRKGLVPLLEAGRRVPGDLKILAVGVKPDAALAQYIRTSGNKDRVIFLPTTDQIAPLYAAADCFALPTKYDTFSMAALEAMASGLPVILSRAAGVSELVTAGRDCLLIEDSEDVSALAQHLTRLAQDSRFRESLGQQARKTAEGHSWDRVAERTLAAYRQAASS